MPAETIHECGCGPCTRDEAHPGREYHRHMNLLLSRLDEQQRRWYLAVESERFGYGADRILFEITGVDEKTIRRGRQELAASLVDRAVDRVRLPGGGRPRTKKPGWQTLLGPHPTVRGRYSRRDASASDALARSGLVIGKRALDSDPRRLAAAAPADPSVHYLRLRAVRSALPSRRGGRLCVAPRRDWPRRHRLRRRQ